MGFFGTDYRAKAENNDFNAKNPLNQWAFADTIQQSQNNAMSGQGQANATAAQQQSLADALGARARGEAPSVAQMQLQQATDDAAAHAASAIASQRGLNPALAQRMALQAQAAGEQQMAGQAAQLRAQEQTQAQAALANALQAQRGQDINQMQANAGLLGTAGGLQVQAGLGTQQINAQTAAQNQQAAMDAQQINANLEAQAAQNRTAFAGAGLNAIGGIGGAVLGKFDGGEIPGEAAVPGDHPANDTQIIAASPDEIMIPRSIAMAEDAPERAAAFVAAIKQQEAARDVPDGSSGPASYRRILELERELAALRQGGAR